MRALSLLLLLAASAGATPTADAMSASGTDSVWVAQRYALGVQCEAGYDVPDTEALLRAAGVVPGAVAVEPLPRLKRCGVPAYAAVHHARVAAGDLDRAAVLGYAAAGPPSAGRLDLVWLRGGLALGRQCDPAERWTRDDVRDWIRAAGVEVYGFRDVPRAVCRSCDCPSYAAEVFVRVERAAAASAEPLGLYRAGRLPR